MIVSFPVRGPSSGKPRDECCENEEHNRSHEADLDRCKRERKEYFDQARNPPDENGGDEPRREQREGLLQTDRARHEQEPDENDAEEAREQ
jgi:hypothetical protein